MLGNVSEEKTFVLPENRQATSILICVVAYVPDSRQLKLFERSIDSILALDTTDEVRANVVVIDNASPLAIDHIVSARASELISLLRREENNLGAARSQALKMAVESGYDWIAFVDSDVEVPPTWLMTLFRELQTAPLKDAVGIAAVNRPPHESEFAKALDFFLGFQHAHLGATQVLQLPAGSHAGLIKMKVAHLPTCAVLLKVKPLFNVGGFDAKFSRVGEDLEMSFRLKRSGTLWLVSEPVVLHRQDTTTNAWGRRMFRYGWAQIDVARKYPEHLQSKKALPLVAGFLAALSLLLMFVGFSAPMKLLVVSYIGFMLSPILLKGISDGRMDVAFGACWIAFVTHASYSAGMWAGVLKIRSNPRITQQGDVGSAPSQGRTQ